MTIANDKRLLILDFVAEVGDMLAIAGAAISSAAAAGRHDVLELAFRQAQNAIADGLNELSALSEKNNGGGHE